METIGKILESKFPAVLQATSGIPVKAELPFRSLGNHNGSQGLGFRLDSNSDEQVLIILIPHVDNGNDT